jgi:chemotaxis protein histidine kinase CheA
MLDNLVTHKEAITLERLKTLQQVILYGQSSSLNDLVKVISRGIETASVELKKPVPAVKVENGEWRFIDSAVEIVRALLVHLTSNSIDHGLNADKKGTLTMTLSDQDQYTLLTYGDDGDGVDLERLRVKGQEKGTLKPGASDLEVANQIFLSGISTKQTVTKISGRGVGMDVVKSSVEGLGGKVTIEFKNPKETGNRRQFWLKILIPRTYVLKPEQLPKEDVVQKTA